MIVIDASAAIKIVLTEKGSNVARKAFSRITAEGEPLLAPDIIFSEVMNGLWKHNVVLKDIDDRKLGLAKSGFLKVYESLELANQPELAEDAMRIALDHRVSFYDSLYVALSVKERAPLFTFDKQLQEKAGQIGLELLGLDKG